jgi:putative FmdB family regulatory protein
MPTYEYICQKCGHSFEKIQSIKANTLTVCPRDVCPRKPWGKGKVQRHIGGGAGLIFKGSGFYATDYRSENYKAGAKKDKAAQTTATSDAKSATPAAGTAANSSGAGKSSAPTPSAPASKKESS